MRELVHWSYFNGMGLFSDKNSKESLTKVYLVDERGRELIEKGKIAALSMSLYHRSHDPYFEVEKSTGFTRRAMKHGDMYRAMQGSHPELERKLSGIESKLVDYGDYVFIKLAYTDNMVNPLVGDSGYFVDKNFVTKENFNKNFILTLIDYKPRALMGGVISDFQEKELPEFMLELKSKFPDLYAEVLNESTWLQKYDEEISYVNKFAKVRTLSPGKVEVELSIIDKSIFDWGGEVLRSSSKTRSGETVSHEIVPSENMVVKIKDDNAVNKNTEFAFG